MDSLSDSESVRLNMLSALGFQPSGVTQSLTNDRKPSPVTSCRDGGLHDYSQGAMHDETRLEQRIVMVEGEQTSELLPEDDERLPLKSCNPPLFSLPAARQNFTQANRGAHRRQASMSSRSTAVSESPAGSSPAGSSPSGSPKTRPLQDVSSARHFVTLSVEPPSAAASSPSEHIHRQRDEILRCAEIVVKQLDCVLTELRIRRTLLRRNAAIVSVHVNPISQIVFIDYLPARTSAVALTSELQRAALKPISCWLRSLSDRDEEISLSQLTLVVPRASRTQHGRMLLQNHTLAQDGLKSCAFVESGTQMVVTYDSCRVGAREVLRYIGEAGSPCELVDDSKGHRWGRNLSKARAWTPAIVALLLLATQLIAPRTLQYCAFRGIPRKTFMHAVVVLGLAAAEPCRNAFLAGMRSMLACRLLTAHLIVCLMCGALLFASITGAVVVGLLPEPSGREVLPGTAADLLCFDQVAWLLLVWLLGLEATNWLKRRICRPLDSLEDSLSPSSQTRLISDTGRLVFLPRCLIQPGDVIVARPGETLLWDGVTMSTAIVKETLLATNSSAWRPALKSPGEFVHAGALVMSGELHVRVTTVGETKILQYLTVGKRQILRNSDWHQKIIDWAQPYALGALILAIASGGHTFLVSRAKTMTDKKDEEALLALMKAACMFCAVLSSGITRLIGAGATTADAAAGNLLVSLGVLASDTSAVAAVSRAGRVVVTRSAMTSGMRVAAVALCPSMCRWLRTSENFGQRCRGNNAGHSPNDEDGPGGEATRKQQRTVFYATSETMVETRDEEEFAPLLWAIIVYLAKRNLASRLSRFFVRESNEWQCDEIVAEFEELEQALMDVKTARVHQGKGVECHVAAFRGIAAAGSFDFVAACHEFGLRRISEATAQKEWEQLQAWGQTALRSGADVIAVAVHGIPVGAVVVSLEYAAALHASLEHFERFTGKPPLIITGAPELATESILARAGVQRDQVMCGLSSQEKLELMARLSTTAKEGVLLLTQSSQLADSVAAQRSRARGGEIVTVLVNAQCAETADLLVPSSSLAAAVNALKIARLTSRMRRLGASLAFALSIMASAASAVIIPRISWRFGPAISLALSFWFECLILLLGVAVVRMQPIEFPDTTKPPRVKLSSKV